MEPSLWPLHHSLSLLNQIFSILSQLAKELRSGEVSVSELCNRCKERASKLNSLNALVTTTFEQAEKHALESNQRIQSGLICYYL